MTDIQKTDRQKQRGGWGPGEEGGLKMSGRGVKKRRKNRKYERDREFVKRGYEGVSGWETHTVSRSTSSEQRDIRLHCYHFERDWERWKQKARWKEKTRERVHVILPLGRWESSKEPANEINCVMYMHALAYVCIYIYAWEFMNCPRFRILSINGLPTCLWPIKDSRIFQ